MTKKKRKLTPMEKILLVNGGAAHRGRKMGRMTAPKKKGGRRGDKD